MSSWEKLANRITNLANFPYLWFLIFVSISKKTHQINRLCQS
jgi:hypothetical protein